MTDLDRRQQIIDGAMRTFSRHGFHKASIKAIAGEAGIRSPALIYHYFENKRQLLEAIIEEFTPFRDTPLVDPSLAQQWLLLPPETLLPELARRMLKVQEDEETMRFIRIFFSEAVRNREIAEAAGTFQRRALAFVERYLQQQVDAGRLRPHDVPSAARMLVGAGLVYILGNEMFPAVAADFPARDDYAESIVDILLKGLQPLRSE